MLSGCDSPKYFITLMRCVRSDNLHLLGDIMHDASLNITLKLELRNATLEYKSGENHMLLKCQFLSHACTDHDGCILICYD